jgi:AraC-like DNA-binding protein
VRAYDPLAGFEVDGGNLAAGGAAHLEKCDESRQNCAMLYDERLPAPALRALIRCYWFLRDGVVEGVEPLAGAEDEGEADPAFPDGSPELILNFGDPFIAVSADGSERTQPSVFLVGQITGPFHVRPSGRIDLVGVRLESHGATWLAEDLEALTDTFVAVTSLGEAARALEPLSEPAERAHALDAVLAPRIAAGRQADWRVADAVHAIRTSNGLVDVAELAGRLKTTPRTLQRLFARDVGIAPKHLARIVRFQRVFSAWRADPASLSRVAAECGYFDHAHLVRDFRELAGVPPAKFLPNQPEFTRFFTA